MALRIERTQRGKVAVLELHGRLTFGQEELLLNDELRRAIAGRRTRLVIDLSGVDRMDSAGLGALLYARAELRRAGGGLALAGLHPVHLRQLMVAGLETAFCFYGTAEDAIRSFSPRDTAPLDDTQAVYFDRRVLEAVHVR